MRVQAEKITLFFFITFFVISASISLLDYSFWWDELYTITAVHMNLSNMWEYTISPDIHPPLYQFILKLWLFFFSDSLGGRGLSLLFVMTALFFIYKKRHLLGDEGKLLPIIFVISWPALYYSSELRSYSLMLMLSTLIFLEYLDKGHRLTFKSVTLLILLSWTHYFGLAFSLLYIFSIIFFGDKERKSIYWFAITCLFCVFFLVFHVIAGDVLGKTGGDFWIKSHSFSAVTRSLGLFLPFEFIAARIPTPGLVGLFLLVFLCVIAFFFYKKGMNYRISIFVIVYLLCFSVVDEHTPMSTTRNFICLFPLMCYMLSQLLSTFTGKFQLLVIGLFVVLIIFTGLKVKGKIKPSQNNKGLYELVESKGIIPFHPESNNAQFAYWNHAMYNYYSNVLIEQKNILEAIPGDYYVSMHTSDDRKQLFADNCFEVEDELDKSTFLFIKIDCN